MTDQKTGQQIERRALVISMWANLFMGVTGVICAVLSHSNAILVDGLFSTIGFTAAVVGRRISARAEDGPDRFRPFGYAADEAIFTTFRSHRSVLDLSKPRAGQCQGSCRRGRSQTADLRRVAGAG